MIAYHGSSDLKAQTLAELEQHRALDEIVQGVYWQGGEGCAVGCLTHDPGGGHDQFPARWGIPVEVARLMDALFEMLASEDAKDWPIRVMSSIPVGGDLSLVWPRWALWMLDRLPHQSEAVTAVAALFRRLINGDAPALSEWQAAAQAAVVAAVVAAQVAAQVTAEAAAAEAAWAAAEAAAAAAAEAAEEAAAEARAAEARAAKAWAAEARDARAWAEARAAEARAAEARDARARDAWVKSACDELIADLLATAAGSA